MTVRRWIAVGAASALGIGALAGGAVSIAAAMPLIDSTTEAGVAPIAAGQLLDIKGYAGREIGRDLPTSTPSPTSSAQPVTPATPVSAPAATQSPAPAPQPVAPAPAPAQPVETPDSPPSVDDDSGDDD